MATGASPTATTPQSLVPTVASSFLAQSISASPSGTNIQCSVLLSREQLLAALAAVPASGDPLAKSSLYSKQLSPSHSPSDSTCQKPPDLQAAPQPPQKRVQVLTEVLTDTQKFMVGLGNMVWALFLTVSATHGLAHLKVQYIQDLKLGLHADHTITFVVVASLVHNLFSVVSDMVLWKGKSLK